MKKLLSINNYHYRRGGADVQYLEHAANMERLGWEKAFFSMQHPKNLETPWSRYFIDEIELGSDYTLGQKITKGVKAIYNHEAQRRLRALLQDFRPHVAQLHNIYHHLSPAILRTLKDAGIPVVLTAHDLKLACPNYQMIAHGSPCDRCKGGNYLNVVAQRCVHDSLMASSLIMTEAFLHNTLLRSYQRHVDRITVPSRAYIDIFVDWGLPREKFVYIPNYTDTQGVTPHYEPGAYFLYFGRLSREKGVDLIIEAASKAGVPLKLAGTGPLEAELKAQAERSGVDAEFLGFRSGEDLHELIRGARATILFTRYYENAPLSVLESFGFGKPVIGSTAGGIPEMVVDGQSGWVVPANDVDRLSETLRRVADMPDTAVAEMGRRARNLAVTTFGKPAYERAFVNLYSELLGS